MARRQYSYLLAREINYSPIYLAMKSWHHAHVVAQWSSTNAVSAFSSILMSNYNWRIVVDWHKHNLLSFIIMGKLYFQTQLHLWFYLKSNFVKVELLWGDWIIHFWSKPHSGLFFFPFLGFKADYIKLHIQKRWWHADCKSEYCLLCWTGKDGLINHWHSPCWNRIGIGCSRLNLF